MPEETRLNKLLAEQLGLSRRDADDKIAAGRVLVNGVPAVLGARISRDSDTITLDGTPVASSEKAFTYLLLHKPVNYVCSRRQQGSAETIYALLPPEYQKLKTVGRLDKDSSGLILLTDDGDFAHRMTHPSFVKTKVYEVALDKPLEPLHQQMINDYGVQLPDGGSKFSVTSNDSTTENSYTIVMHEGRNRQIRRTFAALGYTVVQLHRTAFGPYTLDELPTGKLKQVSLSPSID